MFCESVIWCFVAASLIQQQVNPLPLNLLGQSRKRFSMSDIYLRWFCYLNYIADENSILMRNRVVWMWFETWKLSILAQCCWRPLLHEGLMEQWWNRREPKQLTICHTLYFKHYLYRFWRGLVKRSRVQEIHNLQLAFGCWTCFRTYFVRSTCTNSTFNDLFIVTVLIKLM